MTPNIVSDHFSETDNCTPTASRAGTSVTGLEGLLVVTLAKIVSAGVDNNGALCNS